VIHSFEVALIIAALVFAVVSLVYVLRKKPVGPVQLGGLALVEAALIVQVVLAVIKLADGQRPHGGMALFIGYLAGSLVILPVAAVWGLGDRSRWGSAVVVVAYLVIAVLAVRMEQVWRGV
jgi:hypothetical protein